MRGVVLREFGPPENLAIEDVPVPRLGPGQVLIEVGFAGITFVETQIRAGKPPVAAMAPQLPVILGNGIGGVVTEVGPDADSALAGRRFLSTTGGRGGYAEQAAVPADGLIAVPGDLGLAEAVALLADGRTAVALIRAAAIEPGQRVLVEAAAGGVGSLLVQLARNAGAQVVAVAGRAEKLSLATELGAALAISYRDPDWAERVARDTGGVDVVFDGVGGRVGADAFTLLADGGKFCAYGMSSGAFARISDSDAADRRVTVVRGIQVTPEQMGELTWSALAEAAAGRLRPHIGQRFPLDQAGNAHTAMESRAAIGKTLLVV